MLDGTLGSSILITIISYQFHNHQLSNQKLQLQSGRLKPSTARTYVENKLCPMEYLTTLTKKEMIKDF
jgi:phage gp37-like protein